MPTPTNPTPDWWFTPNPDLDLRLDMYDRGCRCDSCVAAAVAHIRGRVENLLDPTKGVPAPPDPRDATITHLATLLDGVLADDPQAIRDAAAWLTVNRPEVES